MESVDCSFLFKETLINDMFDRNSEVSKEFVAAFPEKVQISVFIMQKLDSIGRSPSHHRLQNLPNQVISLFLCFLLLKHQSTW